MIGLCALAFVLGLIAGCVIHNSSADSSWTSFDRGNHWFANGDKRSLVADEKLVVALNSVRRESNWIAAEEITIQVRI